VPFLPSQEGRAWPDVALHAVRVGVGGREKNGSNLPAMCSHCLAEAGMQGTRRRQGHAPGRSFRFVSSDVGERRPGPPQGW